MRVLGRIRLSQLSEESTSIERQRDIITKWADSNGHTIVGWAEDVDVSGSVDPFKTAGLGPWLTPEKVGEWDILCAWKMDRLARSAVKLHLLMDYCLTNNKTIICVADNIDLSSWAGRMVASVIAGVAEGELENIRERVKSSQTKLKQSGRWRGGRAPFGYRIVQRTDGPGKALEPNPQEVAVLHRMIDLFLGGAALASIADQFNEEGVPTLSEMRGYMASKWNHKTISGFLTTKANLGYMCHRDGNIVLDEQGNPVKIAEPIITLEQHNKILELHKQRSTKKSRTRTAWSLLWVAYCKHCGNPLRGRGGTNKNSEPYVACRGENCPHRTSCYEKELTTLSHQIFLDAVQDIPEEEKIVHAPKDHTERIAELKESINGIIAMQGAPDMPKIVLDGLTERLKTLGQQLEHLEKEQASEAWVEWRPTGRTYGEVFEQLDTNQRRLYLQKLGVKLLVENPVIGKPRLMNVELVVPEDLRERLRA